MPVAIFDMDGVLYRGSTVLPGAKETLERLRHAGWQVFFATNNSTATRAEYVERRHPDSAPGKAWRAYRGRPKKEPRP